MLSLIFLASLVDKLGVFVSKSLPFRAVLITFYFTLHPLAGISSQYFPEVLLI